MESIYIGLAGCLGMAIAVVHGYLGETKVVRAAQGLSASQKRVLQAVMFLSAVYWFVGGAVLVAGLVYLTPGQQRLAAFAVGMIYLTGAIGNAWATGGFHIGWALLSCAVALAWLGAWKID